MRTTLNIEEDALTALRKYAADRRLSLGEAASDLISRGVESIPKFKTKGGFAIIELPPDAPPITDELIKQYADEYYEEEHPRAVPSRR